MDDRLYKVVDECGFEWDPRDLRDWAKLHFPQLSVVEGVLIDEYGDPYLVDSCGNCEFVSSEECTVVMRNEQTCTIEGSNKRGNDIIEWVLSCGHRSLQYIGGAKYWPSYCEECGAKVEIDDAE